MNVIKSDFVFFLLFIIQCKYSCFWRNFIDTMFVSYKVMEYLVLPTTYKITWYFNELHNEQ